MPSIRRRSPKLSPCSEDRRGSPSAATTGGTAAGREQPEKRRQAAAAAGSAWRVRRRSCHVLVSTRRMQSSNCSVPSPLQCLEANSGLLAGSADHLKHTIYAANRERQDARQPL